MNSRGFTLIEIVIVMVIVAILSAVAITRFNYNPVKLNSAVRKVAGDIRFTQMLAITSQSRAAIVFNANGYSVYSDITLLTPAKSPGDVCSTDAAGNFVADFTQARCSDFSGVAVAPNVTVAFNSLGSPVDGSGAPFLSSPVINLTLDGSIPITIDKDTGRVSY